MTIDIPILGQIAEVAPSVNFHYIWVQKSRAQESPPGIPTLNQGEVAETHHNSILMIFLHSFLFYHALSHFPVSSY